MSTTEVLPAATAKLPAIVFSLQPGLKVECPPSGLEGKKKKKRRRRKEKEKKKCTFEPCFLLRRFCGIDG